MERDAAAAPVPRVREWVDQLIGTDGERHRVWAYRIAQRELHRPLSRSAVSQCHAALAAIVVSEGHTPLDAAILRGLAELCVDELLETIDRSCARVLRAVEIEGRTLAQLQADTGSPRRLLEGRLRWAQHGIAQRLDEVFTVSSAATDPG